MTGRGEKSHKQQQKKKKKRKKEENTDTMTDKTLKISYAVSQIPMIGDTIARGCQLKQLKFSGRVG